MLPHILTMILLTGAPYEIPKKTVYILVDTQDTRPQSSEIVKQSKIIISELHNSPLLQEKFYINQFWNVQVEEFIDKRFTTIPKIPGFRFNKNQEYIEFLPGSFKCSGTFFLNLHNILIWEDYIWEMGKWNEFISDSRNQKWQRYTEWTYENHKRNEWTRGFWIYQPPRHPKITRGYKFYEYQKRLVYEDEKYWDTKTGTYKTRDIDIESPEGEGTVFWEEFSNNALWFVGISDSYPIDPEIYPFP